MENNCKQCPYNKGVKKGNGLLICPCADENSFYSPCEFQAFDKIWVEIEDEKVEIENKKEVLPMNKQNFMLTLNKWREEKNLARLVYRIIKFEDLEPELSYKQICNRAKNFIYTKQQLADMKPQEEKDIADFKLRIAKRYEAKGYTNIKWIDSNITFYKGEQGYFSYYTKEIDDIKRKYIKMIYSDEIQKAIETVLNAKWIEEVKIVGSYGRVTRHSSDDIVKGAYMIKYRATR